MGRDRESDRKAQEESITISEAYRIYKSEERRKRHISATDKVAQLKEQSVTLWLKYHFHILFKKTLTPNNKENHICQREEEFIKI